VIARSLGQIVSASVHQQIVVDNRPGGGGLIGYELAARAAPDGYTTTLAISGLVTAPVINPKVPYDPVRDFTPIALVGTSPYSIVVHPGVAANTIQEFRALLASAPKQVNYGSSGYGGGAHLAIELFKIMAGVDMVHVPYKGTGPAMTDLIAGRIHVMFAGAISSLPHIKAGRVRALAVTGRTRSTVLPQLPTLAESIVPGYEAFEWFGLLGPARLPAPVVSRLYKEVAAAMNTPAFREQMLKSGLVVASGTPGDFAKFIMSEQKKWARVVSEAKITPE
jgi:tripartite-type tricarboxylate transporter receptor subunit TctC